MAKDIKLKSVALNILDPDQLEMFEFLDKKTNCSGYLKRLVYMDMAGMKPSIAPQQQQEIHDFDETSFI